MGVGTFGETDQRLGVGDVFSIPSGEGLGSIYLSFLASADGCAICCNWRGHVLVHPMPFDYIDYSQNSWSIPHDRAQDTVRRVMKDGLGPETQAKSTYGFYLYAKYKCRERGQWIPCQVAYNERTRAWSVDTHEEA